MEVYLNFEAILKTSEWGGYFVESRVQILVGGYGIFVLALIDRQHMYKWRALFSRRNNLLTNNIFLDILHIIWRVGVNVVSVATSPQTGQLTNYNSVPSSGQRVFSKIFILAVGPRTTIYYTISVQSYNKIIVRMRSLSTEWQYMTVQLAFSYTSLLA
jgi:hypothetical protein